MTQALSALLAKLRAAALRVLFGPEPRIPFRVYIQDAASIRARLAGQKEHP